MTDRQAWDLIVSSAPYKKANGDLAGAWMGYARLNPRGAEWLLDNAGIQELTGGQPPSGVTETAFGRGMRHFCETGKVALLTTHQPATVPPPVTPPRPVERAPFVSSMIVNAGAASADMFQQAGMTYASVELNDDNARDFSTPRWQAFSKGWFLISRGNDGDYIAGLLDNVNESVDWAIIDTESHKADMGGSLAWTETLYAACRSKVGPSFPLYNVTFGIHSSPAVVNHDAFRRHNIVPVWEAYDGDGRSLGVNATARKVISEGWPRPHIAIGDKTIPGDAHEIKGTSLDLGSVWCWAPEQSGTDVLALKGVFG